MTGIDNVKLGIKLLVSFCIVALIIVIVAVVGYINLNALGDSISSMYDDQTLPIQYLGKIDTDLFKLRGDLNNAIIFSDNRSALESNVNDSINSINREMGNYRTTHLSPEETAALVKFDPAWVDYQTIVKGLVDDIKNNKIDHAVTSMANPYTAATRTTINNAISLMIDKNQKDADALDKQADVTINTSIILLSVFSVIGLILAVVLGILLTNHILLPLKKVMDTAHTVGEVDLKNLTAGLVLLSNGDLSAHYSTQSKEIDIHRKDEIGLLADSFNKMIDRLHESGQSFRSTITNLRTLIGNVAENANGLSNASQQLASAANQAEQVTNQISNTIQQVTMGINQQTQSATQTAASTDQMGRAIDGVAKGAQEQSMAVNKAASVTSQISTAIQKVAANAQKSAKGATQAADTARNGAKTVAETIQGMQSIKEKVGLSAQKVQEMGSHSDKIGAIVETIDDIASQTNLLALNAAIEAARAGEHGKGFSVVADEVRKLAERSSNATKEIGTLIRDIQKTVAEAVTTMAESTHEVENGVKRANQSDEALNQILKAVEVVNSQVEEISFAAQLIEVSSNELLVSMDSVSAVVEENTASTEQMSANANEVNQAMENIASVSEENSASAEEVSASAEEMMAQVEEVSASAQSLAEMANDLQKLVAQFKI